MTFIRVLISLALLIVLPLPLAALDAPSLQGRVNDQARLLSPAAAARIDQKLAAFERDSSNQIVVLTIPSLQGDDIDQFSIRVAEAWKLGQKGKDNGVLLIIAQAERKVRIEVGMGLQGVLPDISASKIIREIMRPHLKSGNFDQAVDSATDAIIAATKGEFKASPQDAKKRHKKASSSIPGSFIVLLAAVAVAAVAAGFLSRYLAGAAGAVGLPLAAAFSFSGMSLMTLALIGVGGLVAGILLSMLVSAIMSGGGGGGFYGGGWGGGYYGGGSSGGDSEGFSGGGGDFDGGGSSDDY